MKKAISIMLCGVLIFILYSLSVFAEGENNNAVKKKLTVFGDSISAGYNLDDYVNSDIYRSKKCFASIIAAELGAEPNVDFYNFSHAGWTSSQILSSIRNTNPDIVKNSDIILVSAGANEIMDIMEEIIFSTFRNDPTVMQKYSGALGKVGSTNLISMFAAGNSDPEVKELFDFVIGKCTDESAINKFNSAIDQYEKNIKEMTSYIRSTDSDAEIVFIPPYNPTAVVTGNKLVDTIQGLLSDMRDRTIAFSKNAEGGHVHAIDLLDSFDGRYPLVTFILSGDIHPNETGHSEIARLISKELKLDENKSSSSEEEISSEKDTSKNTGETSSEKEDFGSKEPPVSKTVVYVVFGIAAVLVVCIVTHFVIIIARRKK